MGVRDYDAKLGQFWDLDPLYFENIEKCAQSPLQCSLYGYASGNPVSIIDPTGQDGLAALLGLKSHDDETREGTNPGERNVPDDVRHLKAALEPVKQTAQVVEGIAEAGKIVGDATIDMLPIVGTIRAYQRGDIAGTIFGLANDISMAGKVAGIFARLYAAQVPCAT